MDSDTQYLVTRLKELAHFTYFSRESRERQRAEAAKERIVRWHAIGGFVIAALVMVLMFVVFNNQLIRHYYQPPILISALVLIGEGILLALFLFHLIRHIRRWNSYMRRVERFSSEKVKQALEQIPHLTASERQAVWRVIEAWDAMESKEDLLAAVRDARSVGELSDYDLLDHLETDLMLAMHEEDKAGETTR